MFDMFACPIVEHKTRTMIDILSPDTINRRSSERLDISIDIGLLNPLFIVFSQGKSVTASHSHERNY
jgi:hypothetical protein